MAATIKDIIHMLGTQKHKAKHRHAFSSPSKGFFDEMDGGRPKAKKKNTDLSRSILKKYRTMSR